MKDEQVKTTNSGSRNADLSTNLRAFRALLRPLDPLSSAGNEAREMANAMKPITRIAHGKPFEAVRRSKVMIYAIPPCASNSSAKMLGVIG